MSHRENATPINVFCGDDKAAYSTYRATMNLDNVIVSIDDDGDDTEIDPIVDSDSIASSAFESACDDGDVADEMLHANLASMNLNGVDKSGEMLDTANDSDSDESISFDLWTNREELVEIDHIPDSDDEKFGQIDNILEFFRHDDVVMVRYRSNEYYVGSLDLTQMEYLQLQQIDHINVQLKIDQHCIKIDAHNVLSIECIDVPTKQVGDFPHYEIMKMIKLVRIQFSIDEPLLAKYNGTIYTVGITLYNEYKELIETTRYPFGTIAIRLNESRVVCDNQKRIIDVNTPNTYRKNQVIVIGGTMEYDSNYLQAKDGLCGPYSRYVINYMLDMSFEKVDVKLIFSSEHDDCDEIFAENNYPFEEKNDAIALASTKASPQKTKKRRSEGERSPKVEINRKNSAKLDDVDENE